MGTTDFMEYKFTSSNSIWYTKPAYNFDDWADATLIENLYQMSNSIYPTGAEQNNINIFFCNSETKSCNHF